MSQTRTQLVSKILRNIQLEEDGSAPAVQAQTDAASYLNERALDIWKRRLWREYLVLGTYTVPANTQRIALASIAVNSLFASGSGRDDTVSEIISVRNDKTPLQAVDPASLAAVDPDAWDNTGSPSRFVNLGQGGIYLLGSYDADTELQFLCKASFQDIAAGESWILDGEGIALIEGVTGDLIRDHDRDDNRATIRYQKYEAEIVKLIDAQEVQGANEKRFVPLNPWTGYHNDFLSGNYTSPTGGNWFV